MSKTLKTAATSWFDVNKKGLADLLRDKCKSFIFFELIQNAWDEEVTKVTVSLRPITGKSLIEVVVEDDSPDGFADLRDSFTLFAPSKKKGDPELRGRFNLGEKLVLSLCDEAKIISTRGTVFFGSDGSRTRSKSCREAGSEFQAAIRMTRNEYIKALAKLKTVIPPAGVQTILDWNQCSMELTRPTPICTFTASLPTEVADDEGVMRRTVRKTVVEVFEPVGDSVAGIYEMGIPVVDTGDKYTVNIGQKVPLSMSRDNVTPAFLQDVRALVLNETSKLLTEEEAQETWVTQASSDEKCSDEAIDDVLTKRYGEKRVMYDPSDPESSQLAASKGYAVIYGGSLNKGQHANVRSSGAAVSSGSLFPTTGVEFSPDGEPPIPEEDWTDGMKRVAGYAKKLAELLMDTTIQVRIHPKLAGFAACYGDRTLCFSKRSLGNKFFDNFPSNRERVNDLLLHEFGHHYESSHLDSRFHEALTRLGAKAIEVALEDPSQFNG
tara:strand:- start:1977 stop:3458 length:1482 start_codon:yes stop_codon:yes gene_type:complete